MTCIHLFFGGVLCNIPCAILCVRMVLSSQLVLSVDVVSLLLLHTDLLDCCLHDMDLLWEMDKK